MKLTYRQATLDDAVSLSSRLRPEDATEVQLGAGRPPQDVLVDSVAMSVVAEAAVVGETVIAIRGVTRMDTLGVPWMLCSPEVTRWSKRMVADAIPWVAYHSKQYSMLVNMVHAENTKALGWLKRIGFTIGTLYPEWGAGKAPFYQFYRYNNQSV